MFLLRNVCLNNNIVDVLIDKNKFVQIGNNIVVDEFVQVMDCSGKAILPSFANMHTHASMMFLRGIGEDKNLFDWLQGEIWPREAKLNDEFIYHLTKYAVLEMIKSGTTLFNDMYFYESSSVRAVGEMGVRALIPHLFMDFMDDNKTDEHIKVANEFLETDFHNDKIIKCLSGHAVYTTSQRAFQEASRLAKQYNTFLHVHVGETAQEVDDCVAKYHARPVQLLNDWGVLNDKTILAHAVHINDDEIKILQKTNACVVHCPSSNMKLNSGIFGFQKCLDSGVNITLGTDGVSSNNSLSMIGEMKIAALLAKVAANSECAGRVDDIFNAATFNGFKFAGVMAGKIEVGFLADFILVDLNNVFLTPGYNLKSDIIYAADTSCVSDVFCDGRPVMLNHHVNGEEAITENFRKVCKKLF